MNPRPRTFSEKIQKASTQKILAASTAISVSLSTPVILFLEFIFEPQKNEIKSQIDDLIVPGDILELRNRALQKEIKRKFGITVVNDLTDIKERQDGTIASKLTESQFFYYTKVLKEQLETYTEGFIKVAGVKKVYMVGDLYRGDIVFGGLYSPSTNSIIIDATQEGASSIETLFNRKYSAYYPSQFSYGSTLVPLKYVIHHEFTHAATFNDGIEEGEFYDALDDCPKKFQNPYFETWLNLNPNKTFQYDACKKYRTSNDGNRVDFPSKNVDEYIGTYAKTNIIEDIAEVSALVYNDPDLAEDIESTHSVLGAKIDIVKQLYKRWSMYISQGNTENQT